MVKQFYSKFFILITLYLPIFYLSDPAFSQELTFPAKGIFNGFLNQINVLECENINSQSLNIKLTLISSSGQQLAFRHFLVPAYGTSHQILNDLTSITNRFGTYSLEIPTNQSSLGSKLSCRTMFYRNSITGSSKSLEFFYSLPLRNPQSGELTGIYNSFGPAGDGSITLNWLSIINFSNTTFNATVEVYNNNGVLSQNVTINGLKPGSRKDLPLGHPNGQQSGLYIIKPNNNSQAYDALLIRYNPNTRGSNTNENYNFAFPLRSLPGSCLGSPIQLSTMGNGLTDNWLEIANANATPKTITINIKNRLGQTLKTLQRTLKGFSQSHFYTNPTIDPTLTGNVGSAIITCSNASDKILAQSVFYGHIPGKLTPEWAYASQAAALTPSTNSGQIILPINTYLGMANWIKLADQSNSTASINYLLLNQSGSALTTNSIILNKRGTADIGVHALIPSNIVGAAAVWSNTSSVLFNAELLRVLPRMDGQIGYIANIPGIVQDKGSLPQVTTGYFPPSSTLYQDISSAALDSESNTIIQWLNNAGGWGAGNIMRIDFSIDVLQADGSTPFVSFNPTDDFYIPDCDLTPVPVPQAGNLEGENGYQCTGDGDCHLLVVHPQSKKLYEMWRANIVGNTFYGGCLAVWDMTKVYGPTGRGENCTSADAGGLPIAPLLFTADEVATGSINHAIRFILPNSRIRHRVYVHPATHSTGGASGPNTAPPYGARLRLRSDFPLNSLPNEASRVVAKAMQKYGIILTDAGNIALTAQSDKHTTHKWNNLLNSYDLQAIKVTDFQMIESGQRFSFTGDCTRVP